MKSSPKPARGEWIRNPYTPALTAPVTLQLPHAVIGYFAQLAAETGLGQEQLMELFLRNSAHNKQRLDVEPAPDVGDGRQRA